MVGAFIVVEHLLSNFLVEPLVAEHVDFCTIYHGKMAKNAERGMPCSIILLATLFLKGAAPSPLLVRRSTF